MVPFLNWQTAPLNESHLANSELPVTGSKMPQKVTVSFWKELSGRGSKNKPAKTVKEKVKVILNTTFLKMKSRLNIMSSDSNVDNAALNKS